MNVLTIFRQRQRRGNALIPTLLVITTTTMLLGAILPLTLTGYGLSRSDRDRSAALAAAEAGLNWEIGRINNRLWDVSDSGTTSVDGSGNPTIDYWPTATGTAPSTASTVKLLTDSSGTWRQRFLAGTSVNPFTVSSTGSFNIIAEGQVQAADGHVIKRRIECGGGGLTSLFDSAAIFALSNSTSTSSPAWSIGGSSSVIGGCGSNGLITGNGGPTITVGPITLWGSSASISGVTTTGVTTSTRTASFTTDTADVAANLLYSGKTSGSGVSSWAPTGYDSSGNALGPTDKYGRLVNSGASVWSSSGTLVKTLKATDFLDSSNNPILDHSIGAFTSGNFLRLQPGVYYFADISLGNNDTTEIANDYYKADGTALWSTPAVGSARTAINGTALTSDYDSDRNRVTIFVDAFTVSHGSNPYLSSSIGSGLSTALQGDKSSTNSLRYRRPSNFRIYAKNTGNFTVSGSSNSPVEFNANVLHYNTDSSGNPYGSITLSSGCKLYGGLFAYTISMSGGATVEQYGSGVFGSGDPVTVSPSSGSGGGISGGFGGWQWQEISAS